MIQLRVLGHSRVVDGIAKELATIHGARHGIAGLLNIIWGIAGVSNSKFFTQNSVWVVSSLHTWGWITLIIGVIQIIAAFWLFSGGGFGRVLGIIAASIGALVALAGTGATPFWSICVFALCVTVVYQLCKSSDAVAT